MGNFDMKKWKLTGLLIFICTFLMIGVALAENNVPLEVIRAQAKAQKKQAVIKHTPSKLIITHQQSKQPKQPNQFFTHPGKSQANRIYSGSLKDNITRLAQHYGWQNVVWAVPHDYEWVGKTDINAQNFPDLLRQLLRNYPLQAVFYRGNHVLLVRARTLR